MKSSERSHELRISYSHDYDWPNFLNYHKKRLVEEIESIEAEIYIRNICIDNVPGSFSIQWGPDGFVINYSESFEAVLDKFIVLIRRILDIDNDISKIEAKFRDLYPFLIITKGLHIPGGFSIFEAGIRGICGQQISIAGATNLLNQFVNSFPNYDSQEIQYFPEPAAVNMDGLENLRTTNAKKRTLHGFAQWCANDSLYNENLQGLINVPGIGPWTVNYIRMRALHDCDVWMGTDLGIKQMINKLDPIDVNLAHPYRSYLALQLWKMLDEIN